MVIKAVLLITIILNIFSLQPISKEDVAYTWKTFANSSCTSEIKDDIAIIPNKINLYMRKKEKGILYSVIYENKLVIVKSVGKINELVCYNVDNLKILWTYDTQTRITEPPICYNKHIYFYSYMLKSLISVDLEKGKKDRSIAAIYSRNRYPLNASDGKIFYSSKGLLTCYNSSTLDKLWECTINDISYASCVYGNKIVVPTLNKLYAISTLTGAIEWEVETPWNLGTQTLVYKNIVYKVFTNQVRSYSIIDGSLIAIHQEEQSYTISICNDNLIITKFNLGMKSISLDYKKINWYNKDIAIVYLNTSPLVVNDKIFYVFYIKNLRRYRLAMIDDKVGNILWVSDYSLSNNDIHYTDNKLLFIGEDLSINCYKLGD